MAQQGVGLLDLGVGVSGNGDDGQRLLGWHHDLHHGYLAFLVLCFFAMKCLSQKKSLLSDFLVAGSKSEVVGTG